MTEPGTPRRAPGALRRLQDARPGDGVTVVVGGRSYQYRVVALRAYAKSGLPVGAVFGQQVTARLVIVSCGGTLPAAAAQDPEKNSRSSYRTDPGST